MSCPSNLNTIVSDYTTEVGNINTIVNASGATTESLDAWLTIFNTNLGEYVKSAGFDAVTSSPQTSVRSASYSNASSNWTKIKNLLSNSQNITKRMTSTVKSCTTVNGNNVGSVTDIATLQDNIETASSKLTQSQIDLDISTSRQDSITTSMIDQSYIQGFSGKLGFTRPIKPTSVAILIGIGFFIIFVTGLILKDFFTLSVDIASEYFSLSEIASYLSASTSRSIILGVIGTFILYAIGLYVYFYVYLK